MRRLSESKKKTGNAEHLGGVLEMTPDEVDAAKQGHATCAGHGIHRYAEFRGHPQFRVIYDDLVFQNLNFEGDALRPASPIRFSLGPIQDRPPQQCKSA